MGFTLWSAYKKRLKMAIEIVDLPSYKMVVVHSFFVCLPEGSCLCGVLSSSIGDVPTGSPEDGGFLQLHAGLRHGLDLQGFLHARSSGSSRRWGALPLPVAIDFDPLLAIVHIVSANTLEEASKAFQECQLQPLCAECASIAGEAPVNKCPGKVQMWGTHIVCTYSSSSI